MPKIDSIPIVSECTIADCAYNSNMACHAIAITIGDGSRPTCDTFFVSPRHSAMNVTAGVGACKVSVCAHNKDFECNAPSIRVAPERSQGKCMTFAPV